MKAVRATVHGAISILNAIPTGVGGALGVDLWTEAEARLIDEPGRIRVSIPEEEDPRLAVESAKAILEHAGKIDLGLLVKTRSSIPIGKGLKSSSAASDAVALAVAKLIGLQVSDEVIVELAVKASIKAEVTITGAYDDAYTCFFGGLNITDNRARKVLWRMESPRDLEILILVPEGKLYTRSVSLEDLRKVKEVCLRAADLALRGKIWDAMTLNGLAVAAALNLDMDPILRALRAGAYAAGVSGTGPAIAAVASPKRGEEVRRSLERFGPVISCKPNNSRASWRMIGDE
ncbi:MAG: shikimate kinase [Thaumarchaeota archaeon]|nr:MAG: shikimate kinase [Nitrososphaerota archaeon]HDD42389.1 shikimate kinase [Nitrososphaeria archaeon]